MLSTSKKHTVDDYLAFVNLPENVDKYFELRDGKVIEYPLMTVSQSYVAGRIFINLYNFAESNNYGWVFGTNCAYILSEYDFVVADVSFIAKNRLTFPLPYYLAIAPDLAVSIIVSSENEATASEKMSIYLLSGTKMVWVVSLKDKSVHVISGKGNSEILRRRYDINDTLTGEDVLPNFTLPVVKIFPPRA